MSQLIVPGVLNYKGTNYDLVITYHNQPAPKLDQNFWITPAGQSQLRSIQELSKNIYEAAYAESRNVSERKETFEERNFLENLEIKYDNRQTTGLIRNPQRKTSLDLYNINITTSNTLLKNMFRKNQEPEIKLDFDHLVKRLASIPLQKTTEIHRVGTHLLDRKIEPLEITLNLRYSPEEYD